MLVLTIRTQHSLSHIQYRPEATVFQRGFDFTCY